MNDLINLIKLSNEIAEYITEHISKCSIKEQVYLNYILNDQNVNMIPQPIQPPIGSIPALPPQPPIVKKPSKQKIYQNPLPEEIELVLKEPKYYQCQSATKYGLKAVKNCINRIYKSSKLN